MNDKQQRAAEIAELRAEMYARLREIDALIGSTPDEVNLGTWRALAHHVTRCLLEVRDFHERALQRLTAGERGTE